MRDGSLLQQGAVFFFYLIPKSRPTFAQRPCLVVGMPVALAIFLFALVIPSARFQLNDNPGIPFFFAIVMPPLTIMGYIFRTENILEK